MWNTDSGEWRKVFTWILCPRNQQLEGATRQVQQDTPNTQKDNRVAQNAPVMNPPERTPPTDQDIQTVALQR